MKSASTLFLILLLACTTAPALAQAEHQRAHEGPPEGMPQMSEEQAAMMEAWQQAMAPGAPHEELAKTVGDWKLTVQFWMDPNGEPMTSEGTAKRKMTLGGRVLEEVVTADMMGMTMDGLGRTGYDNTKKEYWSTWTDNMSTGVMVMTGEQDGDKMIFVGEATDPMTGGDKKMKIVIEPQGDDKEVAEFFEPGPDGQMIRTMKITYERM